VFFSESFSRSTDLEMAEDAPTSSPFTYMPSSYRALFPSKGSCLLPFCFQWQAGILEVCDFPKDPQIFLLNNIKHNSKASREIILRTILKNYIFSSMFP